MANLIDMENLTQSLPYKKWVASLGDIIYDNLYYKYSNSNIKPEVTSVAYTPSENDNSGGVEVQAIPHASSSTVVSSPYITSGYISTGSILSGHSYYNNTTYATKSDDTKAYTQEDSLLIDYLKGIDSKDIKKIVFKSEEYIKTKCCEKCRHGAQSDFDENYYYCELTKEWNRKDFYCGHSME